MKRKHSSLLLALVVAFGTGWLTGCGGPGFQRASARHVINGAGNGTGELVDGVEFWKNGTPPGRYVVLGYIDDWWRGDDLDDYDFKHLAGAVKRYGGRAAVVIYGDQEAPGLKRERNETNTGTLRLQVISHL